MAFTREDIEKAQEVKRRNRELGIKPLNLMEKAYANPNSIKKAINGMCYDCMGQDTTFRTDIKTCTSPKCCLFPFRPYK